jgi:MoxR-like ATPase
VPRSAAILKAYQGNYRKRKMHAPLNQLLATANTVILGKQHQLKLAVCCLLARGHLLIEDMPGVGKTTLAHTLANLLGLKYQRIQFTSDLLPADILGSSIFDGKTHSFRFHPGPIFHQMILADEINRSTPKAQSALLEAMEEHQVTVEGETRPLPEPFFVIATQNPLTQIGTFPLPESQLDRFLMRIELGYPDAVSERALLKGEERHILLENLPACLEAVELKGIQSAVKRIFVSDALLDYLQALIRFTRESNAYQGGLSPRAGLALLHAAKAWAFLDRRDAVLPEDVQAVLPAVASHRLRPAANGATGSEAVVAPLLEQVAIP